MRSSRCTRSWIVAAPRWSARTPKTRISSLACGREDASAPSWESAAVSICLVSRFGSTEVITREVGIGYSPLVADIVRFFQMGVAPVSQEETIEILAFMEAADESRLRGGAPVVVAEVLALRSGVAPG